MSIIIQKWIWNCVGIIIDSSTTCLHDFCKDGHLFATILYQYAIITADQLSFIQRTDDPELIAENFFYLRIWFNSIDINIDEIYGGAEEEETDKRIWKLLYLLYLNLNDTINHNVMANQLINQQKIYEPHSRFDTAPGIIEVDKKVDNTSKIFAYYENQRHIITWQKYKTEDLRKMLKTDKTPVLPELEKSSKTRNEQRTVWYAHEADENCSIETQVSSKSDMLTKDQLSQPTKLSAKDFIAKIKRKTTEKENDSRQKTYSYKLLITWLLQHIKSDYIKKLNDHIISLLLKQSTYEKQMSKKLFETHLYKYSILKHSESIQRYIDEKETELFGHQLLLKHDRKLTVIDVYQRELNRGLEMQERLNTEIERLKIERLYRFSNDIIDSALNMTYRYAEYKEQYEEYPSDAILYQWIGLFVKNQPIFDIIEKIEDIVEYNEEVSDLEPQYAMEIERQNALDTLTLENYLNNYMNYTDDIELAASMNVGKKIFSHIISVLLLEKYPLPAKYDTSGIPNVDLTVCLTGLIDVTILPMLQNILANENIKIIQMEDVINYCIKAYSNEMPHHVMSNIIAEVTEETFLHLEKQQYGNFIDENSPKRKCYSYNPLIRQPTDPSFTENTVCDEETQITEEIDNREIILTQAAKLGKIAYENLYLGGEIDSTYLNHMFLEYLKSLTDIKGWVLINFPYSNAQVVELEEILTGRPVPNQILYPETLYTIEDLVDLELRELDKTPVRDPNAVHRKSLLYEITVEKYPDYYESYINLFLMMKQCNSEWCSYSKRTPVEHYFKNVTSSYIFAYSLLDLYTITELAKLIILKFEKQVSGSEEILKDKLNAYIEKIGSKPEKLKERFIFPIVETLPGSNRPESTGKESDKRDKKGGKGGKSGKGGKGKKKGKMESTPVIIKIDKATQEPDVSDIIQLDLPKIGDEDWKYVVLKFPLEQEELLATYWETIEETYCTSFKELCFVHRVNINMHVPYAYFCKNYISMLLQKPDDRQLILEEFQYEYNNIELDIRDDVEVKGELHFRINELHNKLSKIAEDKRDAIEIERKSFVRDNWFARQICELLNVYITFLQIEIDRNGNTLQLLSDYYVGMITKMPCDQIIQKVTIPTLEISPESPDMRTIVQYVQKCLLLEIEYTDENPVSKYFKDKFTNASSILLQLKGTAESVMNKFKSVLKTSDGNEKKKDTSKTSSKSKKEKASSKSLKLTAIDPEVIAIGESILEEWSHVVNGEYSRALICLNLQNEQYSNEINELLNYHIDSNQQIYDNINERCENEEASIEIVFELFSHYTELHRLIQERMVLENDQFYIEPNIVLFEDPLPEPDPPIQEFDKDYVFTIKQLNRLADTFMAVAPNGEVTERKFTFMLQDFVNHNTEDESDYAVPRQWRKLTLRQVSLLAQKIYGNGEYVYWKDFIIYNFNVPFPTEKEILEIKQKFRKHDPNLTDTVMLYQYNNIQFWFEEQFNCKNSTDLFRLKRMKELLAKMYTVKEDVINYTALLLDFCKDDEWLVGVVKAIELYLGAYVCHNFAEGKQYKEMLLLKRNTNNTEEEENISEESSVTFCECSIEGESIEERSLTEQSSAIDLNFEKHYIINTHILETVIITAMPWCAKVQNMEQMSLRETIASTCKYLEDPEFDNQVFTHEFFNSYSIKTIFKKTKKFCSEDPRSIINNIMTSC